jgi:NAD-dependent dihydropyrimidine dehydrogenase PreA subunit
MKIKRKIIEIDEERCDGCGQCALACAEGALAVIDGKAKVISDNLCDGLGACIGDCPRDALKIIEREAEEFDEDAVEAHLSKAESTPEAQETLPCGCPSTQIQTFTPCQQANQPAGQVTVQDSALTHWPVQIQLIPPTAPFLKGADLLVTADCVPVAFPGLHSTLLKGKVVMLGCPKFDDTQAYVDKFAEIFKTAGIKSITTMVMEVPCCAGLPRIVEEGLKKAGKEIPHYQVTVSTRGKILENRKAA